MSDVTKKYIYLYSLKFDQKTPISASLLPSNCTAYKAVK